MKVLIIDDDQKLVQLISKVLRSQSCDTIAAFDAVQGLSSAKNNMPDVIVLDINLPGGTGIKTLENLKTNSKTAMIPVLVVTGRTDPKLEGAALELGADGFKHKPLDMVSFYQDLCALCDG